MKICLQDAIDKLVNTTKGNTAECPTTPTTAEINENNNRGGYSWWYWRRSGNKQSAAHTTGGHSTDKSEGSDIKSPIESPNVTITSEKSVDESCDKYRKTLRLTSEQIVCRSTPPIVSNLT